MGKMIIKDASHGISNKSETRFHNPRARTLLPSCFEFQLGDDGLDHTQYAPCSCQPTCGKDCPCLDVGNCCEKYCGCSRSCKIHFRGCHCAKSQCRTQKCPCFAPSREGDPDVCRNCWISCGENAMRKHGDPASAAEAGSYGKSDVTGWGAFIQVSVNKNDYIGEYTGEVLNHDEAERCGELYDHMNCSFFFNLNDRWCIDACRRGDKLKFANHSSKPNCYRQILLVGGEHWVGIFAKEQIPAFSELFYDYFYGNTGPSWARDRRGRKMMKLCPQGAVPRRQSWRWRNF